MACLIILLFSIIRFFMALRIKNLNIKYLEILIFMSFAILLYMMSEQLVGTWITLKN